MRIKILFLLKIDFITTNSPLKLLQNRKSLNKIWYRLPHVLHYVVRLYLIYGVSPYKHTTQTHKTVVRLYWISAFFNTNTLQGRSSFARSKRTNVFATQKQCFCLEWLSESKCTRALRYSSRLLVAARLIWHVKSTGLYIWAKSRFEGAWNTFCNFKLSQSAHANRFATRRQFYYTKIIW